MYKDCPLNMQQQDVKHELTLMLETANDTELDLIYRFAKKIIGLG